MKRRAECADDGGEEERIQQSAEAVERGADATLGVMDASNEGNLIYIHSRIDDAK